MIALTLETAQAWALIIGSLGAAIGSAIGAWFAAKAKTNSGQVKAAIGVAMNGKHGEPTPTLQQQVASIHEKADTAIAQTTQIGINTDGNFAKIFAELQAWKLEAEKLRAENQALRETQATLKDTIAPLLTPPVIVTQAPPAISAPGGRRADDNAEKKGP